MTDIKIFGTDGIRGRAGAGWLSVESLALIGAAAGEVLGKKPRARRPVRALLGHDGRRSGPELLAALARGLSAKGFEVASAGLITTPGLAWLTGKEKFQLGAMVSASHNPAHDNGVKFFSSAGEKLSDEHQLAIETRLLALSEPGAEPNIPESTPPALDQDLERLYLEHLLAVGARNLKLDGIALVLDCANGGGSRVAPRVFGRLGAQVTSIASEPDGDNINRDCGSTHTESLQRVVRSRNARLGIALDGDGDRCILVDERGEIVHGDGIMTVIARHDMQKGRYSDPRIVATVMSNRGLQRALREVGVEVLEVGVGDRQVVECMRREGLVLGGEQSGHIVFGAENAYIGDGILTALHVLQVMGATGKTLSELAAPYQPLPQVLLNVPVATKPLLSEIPRVAEMVRRMESELGDDGRILLRYSGTEPLARVMVEGLDRADIQARARELADCLADEVGAPAS